ncbi:MAG TPA: type VI secretion system tip protein VgrG [Balneolaceae bacterium]|nr:type VI secretion system tip protein VgrG [Balneolaceae bacterium]
MPVIPVIPTQAEPNLATFVIFSNNEQLPEDIGLNSMHIVKTINKVPKATIEFFDGDLPNEDFPLSAGNYFTPGTEIEIKAGYRSLEDTVFKGIVIKHGIEVKTDETPKLVVELRDVCVKMTVGRKNKYFEEVSDSDLIEEIISDYGFESDIEQTDVTHPEMVQYFCTDWDFMLSRADVNGQLVIVDDGLISVKAPSMDGEPVLKLQFGHNVQEFEAGMDARNQYAATLSKSWNSINQEVTELEGADPGIDNQGNITGSELADVIGLESWGLQHNGQTPDQELQAWADAQMMRSRMAKIRGRVSTIGYSNIKPGDIIELGGFGDRFNGTAYVSAIFQEIMPGKKWQTHIEFGLDPQWFAHVYDDILEKPASGLLPAISGLHPGIVTSAHDDPDGEGRIKVRIPIISNEAEGVWARIATLDAGLGDDDAARGTFFNPEVGDEVVVGFFNEDPREPVILGMLHSSSKPAPYDVTEDNNEKGIITRGQLKLTFNDDKKSVTIETPNGNKVELNDDEGSILLEDENGNKTVLDSNGIMLESASDIVLKAPGDVIIEGTNAEIKASASFKAEGGSGAEVSTSGQAVLKGSIVQIN